MSKSYDQSLVKLMGMEKSYRRGRLCSSEVAIEKMITMNVTSSKISAL